MTATKDSLSSDGFVPVPDQFSQLPQGSIKLDGIMDHKIRMMAEHILKALDYSKLADFFRHEMDPFAAGEFWGKIVRASSLAYQYTQDQELLDILDKAAEDILSIQKPDGCISTVPKEKQPYGTHGSDLWERKYLLLGLLGYYNIKREPRILEAIVKLADYTLVQIGSEPKVRIVDTGWAFYGIESCSILEPMVQLYKLTGFERYLGFAKYIVEEEGACKRAHIFESIAGGVDPKDVGNNGNPTESIAKAYEMMSCFEGLIEYYRATGDEQWKSIALTFYKKVRDQEITILGSGGADKPYNLGPGTGEQWNYTAFEQTNPDIELMQETCVTVTWMKLCYQVLRLTGDSTVADQMEKSIYNVLIAALKPEGNFFDYFPQMNGTRNSKVNFSYTIGGFPLSCCTANGPMGMALTPFAWVMNSERGPVINFYMNGSASVKLPNGRNIYLQLNTDYPVTGLVNVVVSPEYEEEFSIKVRIPEWSRKTGLRVNGIEVSVIPGAYAEINRIWSAGDNIELALDMRCRVIDAPHGSNRKGDPFKALVRGPVVLARDKRIGGNVNEAVDIRQDEQGYVELQQVDPAAGSQMQFTVPASTGSFSVMDYASAGSTWDERSEYRTWLPYR